MSQKPKYWQIACGAVGRDYREQFIKYGMAFVGGEKNRARMMKVELDDRVIMKRGISKVVAVGRVVERDGQYRGDGDKDWLRDFDGWDIRAYCFVEWHRPDPPRAASALVRGVICRVNKQCLKDLAEEILETVAACPDPVAEPKPTTAVADDQILEFLIRQGLRPGAAEELTAAFKRIRLLARYYYAHDDHDAQAWEDIREHETRTFLVIPLLLALGWAEQQMKIELPVKGVGKADVACFSEPYSGDKEKNRKKCVLIIETKGFSQGLDAGPQAEAYAKHFPNCNTIVVSNGYCYKSYRRKRGGTFDVEKPPSAYLNLLKPRDKYPLNPEVEGCLEALRLLLPSAVS